MAYFHSPKTGRFYQEGERAPKDIRPIDADRGAQFYMVQSRADAARRAGDEALAASLTVTPEAIEMALVTPERDAARHREARRAWRNARLGDSDFTQLPDAFKGNTEKKARWAKYREKLHDMDLDGDDWPSSPAEG